MPLAILESASEDSSPPARSNALTTKEMKDLQAHADALRAQAGASHSADEEGSDEEDHLADQPRRSQGFLSRDLTPLAHSILGHMFVLEEDEEEWSLDEDPLGSTEITLGCRDASRLSHSRTDSTRN
eukprot:TRINITY_DN76893_c0_g1_i1.p1 TRINITY_DN76893_c0_g1~~TRINITY_DN76893_c0_g1_i1.p1  ORF type:complete len:127 (-),score=21.71 TRINITY_DN76893_c0_g1_i1:420-800(-)